MLWWHWAVLGFVLAGLEILTPGGFYLIFFGLGGLAVGLLSLIGLAEPLWFQLLLFSLFSVVSLALFRNPLLRVMQRKTAGSAGVDQLVGEIATPQVDIAPGAVGAAELRGTTWTARNKGLLTISAQCRCRVTHVNGLEITIEPE
jgi:membrane protein implicated in regulation of membrane protease activity